MKLWVVPKPALGIMVSVPVTRCHSSSKLSARRTSLFWLIADVTCGSIRVAYSASPEASRAATSAVLA